MTNSMESLPKAASKADRPPKPKTTNPIETAIRSWFNLLPRELLENTALTLEVLLSNSPRRWVIYPPMILLPSGSFEAESQSVLHLKPDLQNQLWCLILDEIGKREGKGVLTHLAINSGIPLNKSTPNDRREGLNDVLENTPENILRTPSGLIMLYGDFGPSLSPDALPTAQDFSEAFWVSTKQNGITQIWAPRYTMFSRGNIKEKARLLDYHKSGGSFDSRIVSKEKLRSSMAVDLYAGIGYFVFSYVAMGTGRVFGWELNPWSTEGLRRGAVANGWSIQVVEPGGELKSCDERIIVFLENNKWAEERLNSLWKTNLNNLTTSHVNCGLLPTSSEVWMTAFNILRSEGWLHLHENVGVNEIQERTLDIEKILKVWDNSKTVKVEHVELVKTFAPGVWHCVFDVYISG